MNESVKHIRYDSITRLISDACSECHDACLEFDGFQADCNQCLLYGVKKRLSDIPAADVVPTAEVEERCKEWLKVKGKCPTCSRCSDNREHTTTCPIEEHYALPLDGYCHLYEPMKENENGDK